MLDDVAFDADSQMTGLEIELNLMDADAEPAMRNAEILANLADPPFQTELGQFNLELNARPRLISGDGFADYERDILESLGRAEDRAEQGGLHDRDDRQPAHPHPRPPGAGQPVRQRALPRAQRPDRRCPRRELPARHPRRRAAADRQRLDRARGGVHQRAVPPAGAAGPIRRALERVPGDRRRSRWRSARTRRTCTAAGSGRRPGSPCSSRPPTPDRTSSRHRGYARACGSASGGSPRSSTCSRRTCGTSRRCCRCWRTRTRWRCCAAGGVPQLGELRLHNGTVYRWNRPVYDIMNGRPHLRVENRVLPAGPTVVDMLANAAFYFGLARQLADEDRPIWSQLPFAVAEDNFHAAARAGHRGDRSTGPGSARSRSPTWCGRALLAKAHAGLEKFGVDSGAAGPAARHHRGPLPDRPQRRHLADRGGVGGGASARAGPGRGAARHVAALQHAPAPQRASPHLADRD